MADVALGGRYRLVQRLKLLCAQVATDPEFIERPRAEARAVAQLSHPNITSVHDYGESRLDDDRIQPYLVMELLEGATLHSMLRGGQRLPWQRAASICSEVAMALAHAHTSGLVHRDVSSNNIMITPTGVKVMDFGISALIGAHDSDDPRQLLGTPAYVAPERLKDSTVAPPVDVYAVGILLYRMLRGSLPWAVETPTNQRNSSATGAWPRIPRPDPRVSSWPKPWPR